MQTADPCLAASTLSSQTLILKGDPGELLRYLSQREGVHIDESIVHGKRRDCAGTTAASVQRFSSKAFPSRGPVFS
jgi:hypothetical protein